MPEVVPDKDWGSLAAAVVLGSAQEGAGQPLLEFTRYLRQFCSGGFPEAYAEHVFSETLRSVANARSSKRNVRQTPVWGHGYTYEDSVHGVQDNRAFYAAMQEAVPWVWGSDGRNIAVAGHFGRPDPVGKAEVIAQWHEALPRMAEMTFIHPSVGPFSEEVKGPEMAQSILEMNWPD